MILLVRGPEQGLIAARSAARLAADEGAWGVAWEDPETSAASLTVHSMLTEVDNVRIGVWCETRGRFDAVVTEIETLRTLHPDRTFLLAASPERARQLEDAVEDASKVGWLDAVGGRTALHTVDGSTRPVVAVSADRMLEPGFHLDPDHDLNRRGG